MPYITITDKDRGTITYTTKTVSEAWEVGRVLMVSNTTVTCIEVDRGE